MRVPIRKPGRHTHDKKDPYITEEKFLALKKNLKRMKKIRPHLSKEVKKLALNGDFSENAEYQIAKGRLRGLNQKIIDIENEIKNAVIIKNDDIKDKVKLGCLVTVKVNGQEKTFKILGSTEADPLKNIISHNSPVGQALMNKTVNDIVKIKIKNKEVEYKIIKIK